MLTFTGASSTAPYTFTYNINGGANQLVTTLIGNSINIAAPTTTPGTYVYNLISVKDAGTSTCSQNQAGSATITIDSLPIPSLSGPLSVCANSIANYATEAAMTNYNWTISGGGVITAGAGTNNITVQWGAAIGTYSIQVNYHNANGCTAISPSVKTVNVIPLPIPTIAGSANACIDVSYTYTTEAAMTGYIWIVSSGGTFTSGTATNSVAVKWNTLGPQTLSVKFTNANGCTASATVKDVLVNPLPVPTITGSVSTCMGGSYTYITEANMTGYTWSVSSGGTITAGATTNTIIVTWNAAGTQQINVNYINANGCTAKVAIAQGIIVNQLPIPPTITGLSAVCEGTANVTYVTEAGMTGYTWIVSAGGDITSGAATNEINVSWNTPGPQTITVNYTNANGCTAKAVTVKNITVNQLPIPTITGQVNTCLGVNYTYTTEVGMSGYTWIVSPGGTITEGTSSNTINVTWYTTGNQKVSVNYLNSNGCNAKVASEKVVTVNPLPVPTITGLSAVCVKTSDVIYTTESGMSSYDWNIPTSGIITSGAATNAITVTWNTVGSQMVTVNYINPNGCKATIPTEKIITINPLPQPTINGPDSVCVETSGVIYNTEKDMTNYNWTISLGGTITSNNSVNPITVTWNKVGAQIVSVNYIDVNGCATELATKQDVIVNPLPVPTISISDTTWIGSSYVCTTEPNMTNYDWIVSAGGIISTGAETNSATVKWITLGWQTLSINYIDKNGCTAAAATENKMRVINPPLTKTEGISPNGDGINDLLIFKGLENYPGSKLVIFTRSGEKVYENNNYLNDWDGKFVNKISNSRITLLSGTYYYILKLGGTKRTLKGFIYVGY